MKTYRSRRRFNIDPVFAVLCIALICVLFLITVLPWR